MAKQSGKVKFFNSTKGFGFITPDDGTRDVFISVNEVPKTGSLAPEVRVTYELFEGKKGPAAKDLAIV